MATHSMIGIIRNNCIEVTYCHYEGFLEGNGRILNNFYKDIINIDILISKGAIYDLGTAIINTCYMEYLKNNEIKLGRLHYDYYVRDIKSWIGKTIKYDMIHKMVEDILNHHDKIDFAYLYHEKLEKWLYIKISSYKKIIVRDLNSNIKQE